MLETHYGIQADTACNGQIGVEMYLKRLNKLCMCSMRTYRLILMDLSMPVLSGEDAAKEILKFMRHV